MELGFSFFGIMIHILSVYRSELGEWLYKFYLINIF